MSKILNVGDAIIAPLALPQGGLINGKITASISSNNLIVAIKGLDGNDPSATNPVYVRINGAMQSIAAALSVTVNAGASTFNLGSAELKALKQQLFVYLGFRAASSTVFILLSRIPYAKTYADFSSTATNEKYGAYSGSAPASTDEVVNIGRVDVQNSGTASYNWSLPTGAYVVNHPIYETDWLVYVPQFSAGGSMTFTSVSVEIAEYQLSYNKMFFRVRGTGTTGGSAHTDLQATLPMTPVLPTTAAGICVANTRDATSGTIGLGAGLFNVSNLITRKSDASNYGLSTGRVFWTEGFAPIA